LARRGLAGVRHATQPNADGRTRPHEDDDQEHRVEVVDEARSQASGSRAGAASAIPLGPHSRLPPAGKRVQHPHRPSLAHFSPSSRRRRSPHPRSTPPSPPSPRSQAWRPLPPQASCLRGRQWPRRAALRQARRPQRQQRPPPTEARQQRRQPTLRKPAPLRRRGPDRRMEGCGMKLMTHMASTGRADAHASDNSADDHDERDVRTTECSSPTPSCLRPRKGHARGEQPPQGNESLRMP
jgi:hypothetical protein